MEQSKKQWKEQYKSREVVGGVYRLRCDAAGEQWLLCTTDLQGSQNRFDFCVSTGSSPIMSANRVWQAHGAASFVMEVVEELKKEDTQTDAEFAEEVATLLELHMQNAPAGTHCIKRPV